MKNLIWLLALAAVMLWTPLSVKALDVPAAGGSYSYPLPATGNFVNVVYAMAESGTAQILVYNEAGALVLDSNEIKPAGLQTTQFCLCPMPPGVYLYRTLLKYNSGAQEKLKLGKIVVFH